MNLTKLDNPSFQEVKNSLLQEIRGQKLIDSTTKPNLRLTILPGTMEKHRLCVKPILSNASTRSNNINSLSNSDNNNTTSQPINDSSLSINDEDERNDTYGCVINACYSFKNNRNNNSIYNNSQRSKSNARFNK